VVVGDLVGSGEAQERGIVGETPNLAARLQGIAEPNMVVVAEGTRRLLGNLFEFQDLAVRDLKGIPGPVRAWAALRPSSVESRFEAMHETGLTALIGREEELELLLRRWSKSKSGEGQVVLLSGEPGIGKSRLTVALLERLADEPHTRLRYFCSPQHTDSALYPIIGHMERAAGLVHDDTANARMDKLDAVLGQTSTSVADTALFAEMLSLPNDGRYPVLGLTPQRRRQRTLEALVSQVEALARRGPVLMIFEDAHWTDPTSLEVFSLVVGRIATLRVLLIVTFRPEFDPPWIGRPHVTALNINRLAEREAGAMIDRLVGNKLLPASTRQDIIERTDGIPLFVEEMAKAVLEAESQSEELRIAAAIPSAALAVPASLHASLMARLDRLGTAKEIAQIAAAIGREFSHVLLATVARKPEAELGSALGRLVAAGLLFRQGVAPHAIYLFKHALVQDAAYGTLLREPRCALHARIATTLESQFPDIVEAQPELLGKHFSEGGFEEKAIAYYTVAGERDVKRDANVEAIRHFRRALELLERRPETVERNKTELKVLAKLGPALAAARGFGAPEVETAYLRARDLSDQFGEPVEQCQALWGLWLNTVGRERFEAARPIADQLLALAERSGDRTLLLEAHHAMCPTTLWVGNPQAARSHGEQGMRLYEREQHRSLAFLFGGHDPGVCCRMHSAMALWFLGHPESALERSRTGLAMAMELSHIGTIVNELPFGGIVNQLCGDVVAVGELAESLTSLSTEHGFPQWLAFGKVLNAWVHSQGRGQAPAAELRCAVSEYRAEHELYVPYFLGLLAAVQLRYGESAEGLHTVVEGLELTGGNGSRLMDSELLRLKGESLLARDCGADADAEVALCQAIDIARRQSAKSWELRAAMSMARLWRDQGKRRQAYDLLARVYDWFTEGFDTLDLKQAKALLDELAS
jgi:tetratricopeptide (TPR) repeat protein